MNRKKIHFRLLWIAIPAALSACSYKIDKIKDSDDFGIDIPVEYMSRSSFQEVYAKVFRVKCVACHDGYSGRLNLEVYAAARGALDRIRRTTLVERTMPKAPYPSLTAEEFLIVAAWVKSGGPELPANGSNPPPALPLEPKFASIQKNIIEKKCVSCHGPGGNAARIPLLKLEDYLNSPLELVIPGNPAESGLILSILPGARKPMPPIEAGMSPVKPEEIKVIEDWIQSGATD